MGYNDYTWKHYYDEIFVKHFSILNYKLRERTFNWSSREIDTFDKLSS
jgi:hypothetical protein